MSDNKAETFVVRGNYATVAQQLVSEYNNANGWAIQRVVDDIISVTVVMERNTSQATAESPVKESKVKPNAKKTDATAKKTDITTDTTETTTDTTTTDADTAPQTSVKIVV